MLSVGSLCTGYGGLEMGLQTVYGDIDLRFVSDIDKDVNTLLAHHHPNVPNLGDLTVVDWADIEPVDVLCAGYPCQPFSTAGQRKGLEDERAIFEYIADAISVLRPKHVLLENVAGHLTLGGTDVIATLTRLRYNAKWGIVRASDASAPHQRKRLFIWAETSDTKKRNGRFKKYKSVDTPIRSTAKFRKPTSKTITDTASRRQQKLWPENKLEKTQKTQQVSSYGAYEHAIRRWETVMERIAPIPVDDKGVRPEFIEFMMGLSQGYVTSLGLSRTAELKMLGNGVVPQQAALALHILAEGGYYA